MEVAKKQGKTEIEFAILKTGPNATWVYKRPVETQEEGTAKKGTHGIQT